MQAPLCLEENTMLDLNEYPNLPQQQDAGIRSEQDTTGDQDDFWPLYVSVAVAVMAMYGIATSLVAIIEGAFGTS